MGCAPGRARHRARRYQRRPLRLGCLLPRPRRNRPGVLRAARLITAAQPVPGQPSVPSRYASFDGCGIGHHLRIAAGLAGRLPPPVGTITVLPAMAIGEFADVGSWRRKTIAPVLRLRAIRTPWKRVVKTRSFETVAAPSGMSGTFVSHSTLPVARLSASTSPVAGPAALTPTGSFKLV